MSISSYFTHLKSPYDEFGNSSQISGYVQLSGNRLSGELPPDIGKKQNLTMLHLGSNDFNGKLPPQIGQIPLVVLNISRNNFWGEIPKEIGDIKCLQNLDLSWNNFSDTFPASLDRLTELSKFNISYNPFISGRIPATGQFATFEKDSYLGDHLLQLPKLIDKQMIPLKALQMIPLREQLGSPKGVQNGLNFWRS
jgi:hypothetical protein